VIKARKKAQNQRILVLLIVLLIGFVSELIIPMGPQLAAVFILKIATVILSLQLKNKPSS